MPRFNDQELEDIFRAADYSHDGVLMHEELVLLLKKFNRKMSYKEGYTLIRQYDQSGDKKISFEEFVPLMNTLFPE
ncbi:probable_calcium-binding protein [Hexamita inflata]|uniref:Probable calcium-binding protein n=1 Tax=Hexamita inflata TaxID=28002 RepID=A0AA86R413_9EUKA|nr:probable calcium-binding protein [Hexamita inflata]CAI9971279.1 probable calcium-binding protein [Hexamita inflata]CAI9976031.1 probable calcium-binding protein [Hexamita inflata]